MSQPEHPHSSAQKRNNAAECAGEPAKSATGFSRVRAKTVVTVAQLHERILVTRSAARQYFVHSATFASCFFALPQQLEPIRGRPDPRW